MNASLRKLAVVTGASTGIGLELAKLCAKNDFDLIVAANEAEIENAASTLRRDGISVTAVECDLATTDGVEKLVEAIDGAGRPVDALLANAGRGLGKGFLDQNIDEAMDVVNTNISGTIYLVHEVGAQMRDRGAGKILITGSIAGLMPGTFQAVYNGTKAFLDSFSVALNNELKDTGVTVTCLLPGATETPFFERADSKDTKVGTSKKDDPADVAKTGFDAMMKGDISVIHGFANKMRAAAAAVAPEGMMAEMHRKMAEPGSAKEQ